MKKLLVLILTSLMLILGGSVASAQDDTVRAVFFYLPTCKYCHEVMNEHLPPLYEQYGDQLDIAYVDVSLAQNKALLREACSSYSISSDECGSVPRLIVGDYNLSGAVEIPTYLPGIIEEGLANGGIPYPDLPSIQLAVDAPRGNTFLQPSPFVTSMETDPIASLAAIGVLFLSLGSMIAVIMAALSFRNKGRAPGWLNKRTGWTMSLIASVLSTVIAATLVFNGGEVNVAVIGALVVTVLMIAVTVVIWQRGRNADKNTLVEFPGWTFPVASVAGVIVAGYLSYVETTSTEAVCGLVGNCNAVQESAYASLFGVLPVGVLGLVGYALILLVWFFKVTGDEKIAQQANVALLGLILFGVAFSIYLTFLEPFVIGATCAWCLTSALLMLLLLWMIAPQAWLSLQEMAPKKKSSRRQRTSASW